LKAGYVYRSGKSLLAYVSLPFMADETFLLLQNKERKSDKEPMLKVLKRLEKFGKNADAGGVWERVSKNGNLYKSMSIETPFAPGGTIYLTIFNMDEPETIVGADKKPRRLIATINYSAPRQTNNSDYTSQGVDQPVQQSHTEPNVSAAMPVIDDDEIPF